MLITYLLNEWKYFMFLGGKKTLSFFLNMNIHVSCDREKACTRHSHKGWESPLFLSFCLHIEAARICLIFWKLESDRRRKMNGWRSNAFSSTQVRTNNIRQIVKDFKTGNKDYWMSSVAQPSGLCVLSSFCYFTKIKV